MARELGLDCNGGFGRSTGEADIDIRSNSRLGRALFLPFALVAVLLIVIGVPEEDIGGGGGGAA